MEEARLEVVLAFMKYGEGATNGATRLLVDKYGDSGSARMTAFGGSAELLRWLSSLGRARLSFGG